MILKRDDSFKAVCEIRTRIDLDKYRIGTGLFVCSHIDDNRYYGWIITASHVAVETTEKSEIVVSTEDGKAKAIPLEMFGPISNWKHHPFADLSVFQVFFSEANEAILEKRFFPYDHICTTKDVISRDAELTCIGFPQGLGTSGAFSPFSFRSYAASSYVTLSRADNGKMSDFFCLENPSMGGYSGGPVFDLGYSTNGLITMTKEKTWCLGFIHGTMSDKTGGKIALVTPSFYLKDIMVGY